jgi:dTDP-glucose 4,6-dehydratase
MRVLVTGGAGFIGSNYVQHLLRTTDGVEVTTLDALTYAGEKANLGPVLNHPRHEFVEGDIRDNELVRELLPRADVVVHFAAQSHVDRSIEGAAPFVSTNVGGAQTMLEAALDHSLDLFIQISTDEVYGEIVEGTFSEQDRLTPRNPYAATKAGADLLAHSYYITHDVPVIVTRSSNNYGPHQHPEKLIPKLIQRASSGQSLPIYGDGSNVREWTYVQDTCRAIETVRAKGTAGETYNIGSGEERTNLAVAKTVLDKLGQPESLIEFVEDRPGHDQRYALDTTKIRQLGWTSEWSFEEGINTTIEYYGN